MYGCFVCDVWELRDGPEVINPCLTTLSSEPVQRITSQEAGACSAQEEEAQGEVGRTSFEVWRLDHDA
jgi:hypothetical protein